MRTNRPIVTITTAITDVLHRPDDRDAGRPTPKTNAMTSVRKNAAQYESPQSVSW